MTVRVRHVLSAHGASTLASNALARADAVGAVVSVAVVDAWGRPLSLTRSADSPPGNDTVARDVARTAAIFVRPSGDIEAQVAGGRLGALALHGAAALRGGMPVTVDGEVVGAVGVSGTVPVTDESIALSAVADPSVDVAAVPVVTAQGARLVIDAVLQAASRRGVAPVVAVVDPGGVLVALGRPDLAQVASVAVATDKARTAALFRMDTEQLETAAGEGRPSLLHLSEGVPLQGGVPLVVDEAMVGAVGVSGASSAPEDSLLARHGAAALRVTP